MTSKNLSVDQAAFYVTTNESSTYDVVFLLTAPATFRFAKHFQTLPNTPSLIFSRVRSRAIRRELFKND